MRLIIFLSILFISTVLNAEDVCSKYLITPENTVEISFCDKNGWCKVKDKKLYIKKFLFNKKGKNIYQLHNNLSDRQITYYYALNPKVINKYKECKKMQNSKVKSTPDFYKQGIYFYKKRDFNKSYELFSKIYLQKLMDAKFNFYYGYSASQSGHYEMALASFERVEMIETNNPRVKLEIARVYFKLKMYEDAELKFKEVLQNPTIPENVRTNIAIYLTKISSMKKKSFTYATVGMDIFYDSNINFGSLDSQYNIGNNIFPTQDEVSSSGLQFLGDVTNIYDLGEKNGYILKNKISMLINRYSNNSSFNIGYLSYNPSLIYKTKKYMTNLEFGFDILSVANDIYMKTISLKPQIDFNHSNSLKSSTYLKITNKLYTDKDLDSYQYELSYGLQKILSQKSYILTNLSYLLQDKKQGSRIDVNYDEYKFNIDYFNQLTPKYSLELYMDIKQRKYKDYSELFESTRSDIYGTVYSTLYIQLKKDLRLKLKAFYNRAHSNQKVFSYQKHIISFGIIKTF